jgi:hypothetical protein
VHTGAANSCAQPIAGAARGHQELRFPHRPLTDTGGAPAPTRRAPSEAVTVNALPTPQAAAAVPWQRSVCALHCSPSRHSVAACGRVAVGVGEGVRVAVRDGVGEGVDVGEGVALGDGGGEHTPDRASHTRFPVHTGAANSCAQPIAGAARGHQELRFPHRPLTDMGGAPAPTRRAPSEAVTENALPTPQAAAEVPWQRSVCALHCSPLPHKTAGSGCEGAFAAPHTTRAYRQHSGAGPMPSAAAVPRKYISPLWVAYARLILH